MPHTARAIRIRLRVVEFIVVIIIAILTGRRPELWAVFSVLTRCTLIEYSSMALSSGTSASTGKTRPSANSTSMASSGSSTRMIFSLRSKEGSSVHAYASKLPKFALLAVNVPSRSTHAAEPSTIYAVAHPPYPRGPDNGTDAA
ncbi:hypothetical protein D1007_14456 [Hordeum vulgare]|nr:hypothetical protein D1007_14456 [Hordeum vulgare]